MNINLSKPSLGIDIIERTEGWREKVILSEGNNNQKKNISPPDNEGFLFVLLLRFQHSHAYII